MPPKYLVIICCVVLAALTWAQRQSQPPVKVNVINVCAPSAEEQKEIASALARVPKQPLFSEDFEVDRGHSTLSENPALLQAGVGALTSSESSSANYVRIRREFSIQALFSSVQYSFSVDPKNMVETMVFRVRDPKDLMQFSERQRVIGNQPRRHAQREHSGQPYQAGAVWQSFGCAGPLLGLAKWAAT